MHKPLNTNPPRLPKGQAPQVGNVRTVPMDQVRVPGKDKKKTPATPPAPAAPPSAPAGQ